MNSRMRWIFRVLAALSVASAAALFWYTRLTTNNALAVQRGEEVYASHDCTDCHLSVYALSQKREKKDTGLIRVRRHIPELRQFLEADEKHRSYVMMAQNDRDDLIAYLQSLLP